MKCVILLTIFATVSSTAINEKIVGGTIAQDGEFPYLVSIRYRGVHNCGGAILDEFWVLTAAHCLTNRLSGKMTVVTGTNYLDHGGIIYNVSKIISHSDFDRIFRYNDIGLLKVTERFEFSKKVSIINLPVKNINNEKLLSLAGWGQLKLEGNPPNELRKILLKPISNFKCKMLLKPSFIWKSNFCTLNKKGQGACYGDSGGPLVGESEIKGIVSWSRPCAKGFPDVYTKVYDYLFWINSNREKINLF